MSFVQKNFRKNVCKEGYWEKKYAITGQDGKKKKHTKSYK